MPSIPVKQHVNEIVEQVKQTKDHLTSRARRRLARADQAVRQTAVTSGIEVGRTIGDWLKPASEAGLAPDVTQEVDVAMRERVEQAIPDYDALNVRQIDARVRIIEDVATLALIGTYEQENKGRRTVARSVERQLHRMQPRVPPKPEWMSSNDAA